MVVSAQKKKAGALQRAPARTAGSGEVTAQAFKLADGPYWSLVMWAHERSRKGQTVTIRDICEEALAWFLEQEARSAYSAYRATPANERKRCFWINSQLLERAGAYAVRDGVPRNRVLYTSLVLFLEKFGPVAKPKDIEQLKLIKAAPGKRGRPISLDL